MKKEKKKFKIKFNNVVGKNSIKDYHVIFNLILFFQYSFPFHF